MPEIGDNANQQTAVDQILAYLKANNIKISKDQVQKLVIQKINQGWTVNKTISWFQAQVEKTQNQNDDPVTIEDILGELTGGSPSGSGTLSGGGGASGPDPAVLRANYVEILRRWGIAPGDGGLGNLVDHAIGAEWTTVQFMQAVRKTKAYKQQFPGIQWRNGMTEGEYIRRFGQYRELAQNIGRPLTREQFGILLTKGVTAQEFKVRVDALDRMKRYRPLFAEFEEVLKRRGLIGRNAQLSQKELFNFVVKRGDPAWERIWEESVVRQGLEDAGLTIGKKGDFTRKELLQLINQVDTPRSEVENLSLQDFQKLATSVQEIFPLSQLYGMGVTKKDLAVLALGGKGAEKIAGRVEEIMATKNLQNEQKAAAPLYQTQGGGTTLAYGGLSGEEGE